MQTTPENSSLKDWFTHRRQRRKAKEATRHVHEVVDEKLKDHDVLTQASPITGNNAEYKLRRAGLPSTVPQAPRVTYTQPNPSHQSSEIGMVADYQKKLAEQQRVAYLAGLNPLKRYRLRQEEKRQEMDKACQKAALKEQAETMTRQSKNPDQLAYTHSRRWPIVLGLLFICSSTAGTIVILQPPPPIDQPQADPIPIVKGVENLPIISGSFKLICKPTRAELLDKGPKRRITIGEKTYFLTIAEVKNQNSFTAGACANTAFFPSPNIDEVR